MVLIVLALLAVFALAAIAGAHINNLPEEELYVGSSQIRMH